MPELWHLWVIGGLILSIAEVFTPGFVLGLFGIACFGSALIAAAGMGLKTQLLTFGLFSILLAAFVRPLFLKYLDRRASDVKTNTDALIGQKGRVLQKIDPLNNTGRVKIGGEEWMAVTTDDQIVDEGCIVAVESVDGCKVIVKP